MSSGHLTPACSAGKALSQKVVRAAFEYAQETETPLCAFLGDECVTLRMTKELLVRPCTPAGRLLQRVLPSAACDGRPPSLHALPVLPHCSLTPKAADA